MRRTGAVVLTTMTMTAALLPALAGASQPTVPQVPAGTSVSTTPEPAPVRGLLVRTTASPASVARTVEAALPEDVDVAATRGGDGGPVVLQLDETVDVDVVAEAVEQVRARPDVTLAAPDYVMSALEASPIRTNDSLFPQQRNLWDASATSPRGGYAVKAPGFWGTTRGRSDVVVAVVDTGILAGHPDLRGRLVPGYDFVDDEFTCTSVGCRPNGTFYSAGDKNGLDPDPADTGDWVDDRYAARCGLPKSAKAPSSWHGTHVAGIVAATADNRQGIAGVAPGVSVQPVRALGHCGGSLSDILAAIAWAGGADVADALGDDYYAGKVPPNPTPADVINLSLGANVRSQDRTEVCTFYGLATSAVRAEGATVVAAAGNDSFTKIANANLSVPATCKNVVSVGGTNRSGHRAYYSQAGSTVDVSAPGGDDILDYKSSGNNGGIWSAMSNAPTTPNGSYGYEQLIGTSMSSPHVAAAAALLYSMGATDPALVERTLSTSVTPFPKRSSKVAKVKVSDGRKTFTLADLNCTTKLCGRGVLDVNRFNDRIAGTAVVGAKLYAEGWRRSLSSGVTYAWTVSGSSTVLGRSTSVTVPSSAVGKKIRLVVSSGGTSRTLSSATVARR